MNDTFTDGCCNRILGSPPSDLHTMVVLPWCFHPTSLKRWLTQLSRMYETLEQDRDNNNK